MRGRCVGCWGGQDRKYQVSGRGYPAVFDLPSASGDGASLASSASWEASGSKADGSEEEDADSEDKVRRRSRWPDQQRPRPETSERRYPAAAFFDSPSASGDGASLASRASWEASGSDADGSEEEDADSEDKVRRRSRWPDQQRPRPETSERRYPAAAFFDSPSASGDGASLASRASWEASGSDADGSEEEDADSENKVRRRSRWQDDEPTGSCSTSDSSVVDARPMAMAFRVRPSARCGEERWASSRRAASPSSDGDDCVHGHGVCGCGHGSSGFPAGLGHPSGRCLAASQNDPARPPVPMSMDRLLTPRSCGMGPGSTPRGPLRTVTNVVQREMRADSPRAAPAMADAPTISPPLKRTAAVSALRHKGKRSDQAKELCGLIACGAEVLAGQCGGGGTECDGRCYSRLQDAMARMDPEAEAESNGNAARKAVQVLRQDRFAHDYGYDEGDWLWESFVSFREYCAFQQFPGSKRQGGGRAHGRKKRWRANGNGQAGWGQADEDEEPEEDTSRAALYELQYRLRGVPMCKWAWHKLAGWTAISKMRRKKIPTRSAEFARQIMFGAEVNPNAEKPQSKKPRSAAGNPTDMCRSWIHGYFQTMSCTTPALAGSGDRAASGVMHYSKGRPGYEWNQYKDTFDKDDRIVRSGFNKAWKEQLDKGWTCQKTGAHYVLKERTVRARGFKKCSVCENLEEKMRKAKREGSSPATRLAIREEIEAHLKHIRACRTKYADQNMEAITDASVASAAMDAAAQRGHRLPMLATEHSKLTGMKKLQLKITGVLMHRQGKKVYYAYVTPPWLKTGANMSCSILMALIESGALRGKKRLYLQIDGASDNVAYTVLYFSAWLLLMAQAGRFGEDLVVESIVLSRLPVGHTHIGKCLLVDAGLTPFPLCPPPTHPPAARALHDTAARLHSLNQQLPKHPLHRSDCRY